MILFRRMLPGRGEFVADDASRIALT